MALTITKKTRNIIILVIAFVVLAGSGGYLLWRVNQQDTVAPTDSDAGQNTSGQCVNTCSCTVYTDGNGNYSLGVDITSGLTTRTSSCGEYNKLSSSKCYRHNCGNGQWIMSNIADVNLACKDCSWSQDPEETSGECDFGSQCPACEWPAVGYCDNNDDGGTCKCNADKETNDCDDNEPKCTPTCPSGYTECSGSSCGEDTVTKSCDARCDGCNNAYTVTIKCTKEEEVIVESEPEWTITKTAVEACIDENTENPTAEVKYTINVQNTGLGDGYIDTIVDTLDTKVEQDEISEITGGGVFSDGKLTWDLDETTGLVKASENKTYTYTLTVEKDEFGTYLNTVEMTPTEGDSVSANATIEADCEIDEPEDPEEPEVPDTALFDSTTKVLVWGFMFILFGFGISNVDGYSKYRVGKTRKKLEQKVVKD